MVVVVVVFQSHPIMRRNLRRLMSYPFLFVEPFVGSDAAGEASTLLSTVWSILCPRRLLLIVPMLIALSHWSTEDKIVFSSLFLSILLFFVGVVVAVFYQFLSPSLSFSHSFFPFFFVLLQLYILFIKHVFYDVHHRLYFWALVSKALQYALFFCSIITRSSGWLHTHIYLSISNCSFRV